MSDVKYLWVRDSNSFPVGCFVFAEKEEDNGFVSLQYGYAIFYMKDQFDKSRGREVAQARLEKSPRAVYGSGNHPYEQRVIATLRATVKTEIHQWAKKPATENTPRELLWHNDKGVAFERRPLGHRFREACRLTAEKLQAALDKSKSRAA